MTEHVPFSILVDLAEGRQVSDEQMRAHVMACRACAADIAWLEQTIMLMRTDQLQAASPELVARAKQLFRAPATARQLSIRRRVVATKSFDSLQTPLAFGVR